MRTASRGLAGLALAVSVLAGAACSGSPRAVPPLTVPGQPPPAGTVTDGLGAACPATALDSSGLCPGDDSPVTADAHGVSCRESEMQAGWCPGDAPSWPPPAPVAVPETVTFIVKGGPAAVSYGAYGNPVPGTSPMTVTEPLSDAASQYVISATAQGGQPVTVIIAVDGAVLASDSTGDGNAIALAQVIRNGDNWEEG